MLKLHYLDRTVEDESSIIHDKAVLPNLVTLLTCCYEEYQIEKKYSLVALCSGICNAGPWCKWGVCAGKGFSPKDLKHLVGPEAICRQGVQTTDCIHSFQAPQTRSASQDVAGVALKYRRHVAVSDSKTARAVFDWAPSSQNQSCHSN